MSAQTLVQNSLDYDSSRPLDVQIWSSVSRKVSSKKCWLVVLLILTMSIAYWEVSRELGYKSPTDVTDLQFVVKEKKVDVNPKLAVRQSSLPRIKHDYSYLFDVVSNNRTTLPDYTLLDPTRLTSPLTSIFYPVRTSYEVDGVVELRIEARDGTGKPQRKGGDFWFVTVVSPNNFFRTTAHLVDHANGTYSAFFVAPQPVTLNIRVRLVHPSDAVRWLKEVYMKAEGCSSATATFKHSGLDDGRSRCVVKRGLNHLSVRDDLCFYGAGHAGLGESALICVKPKGFMCDDIRTMMAYNGYRTLSDPVDKLIAGNTYLFNKTHFKVDLRSPESVTSIEIVKKQGDTANVYDRPTGPCGQKDSRGSNLVPEGYWLGQRWVSLVCSTRQWDDMAAVQQCLAGRQIIMLGDSVTCQWFRVLQRKLDGTPIPPKYDRCSVNQTDKLKYFRNVPGSDLSHIMEFDGHFEPAIIDTITDKSLKYVIYNGMSAHYPSWNMDTYRDRMRELRNAIARMRERLGADHVITIVKKTQPREHGNFHGRIHSNDYVFREMGRISEEEFVGIDAKLIDVWDLVLSYAKEPLIHMPWACINEEVNLFLSHICPG